MKLKDYIQIASNNPLFVSNDPLYLINNDFFKEFENESKYIFLGNYNSSCENKKLLENIIQTNTNANKIILHGKTDLSPPTNIPSNLILFMNNVKTNSNNIHCLPMGGDFRSIESRKKIVPKPTRNRLLYCNFSIDTHRERRIAASILKKLPFTTIRHMGSFSKYPISKERFFDELWSHKFSACPRGYGLDTFRFWDSLSGGTIPIVPIDHLCEDFYDLPVLKIKNVNEYGNLTECFLKRKYEDMLNTTYNFDKLTARYWKSKIRNFATNEEHHNDKKKPLKIIQMSPPRTGSTLLANMLHGFYDPLSPVKYASKMNAKEDKCDSKIIKTHNQQFNWNRLYEKTHRLYFVCSERKGLGRFIKNSIKQKPNVVVFEYNELIQESSIEYVRAILINHIPEYPNLDTAKERIKKMNEICDEIKHKPFNLYNKFFHIHGSHRNRCNANKPLQWH